MNGAEFVKYCVAEIKVAVKNFGTYSYNDKGPRDVMSVEDVILEFKKVPKDEAIESLMKLCGVAMKASPAYLVFEMLSSLNDEKEYAFLYKDEALMEAADFTNY